MFWYPAGKDFDERDAEGVTLRDFLKSYDPGRFERPSVTVDILIFKKGDAGPKLLLIERGRHPSFGKLALPGGFIEMDESLEDAAARELLEETGISGISLRQLGAYGDVGRDPRTRIISVAYTAIAGGDVSARAGDDAADAGFYDVSLKQEEINSEKAWRLCFRGYGKTASSIVKKSGNKRIVVESDVTSDHSIMILDGLERLGLTENK